MKSLFPDIVSFSLQIIKLYIKSIYFFTKLKILNRLIIFSYLYQINKHNGKDIGIKTSYLKYWIFWFKYCFINFRRIMKIMCVLNTQSSFEYKPEAETHNLYLEKSSFILYIKSFSSFVSFIILQVSMICKKFYWKFFRKKSLSCMVKKIFDYF